MVEGVRKNISSEKKERGGDTRKSHSTIRGERTKEGASPNPHWVGKKTAAAHRKEKMRPGDRTRRKRDSERTS